MVFFKDRTVAGQALARQLPTYANRTDVIVLALPRGGVPVAFEVAKALNAPLDVLLVRKLGVPGKEELAMGAIASGGVRVLNPDVVRSEQLFEAVIHKTAVREQREMARREQLYREGRPFPLLNKRTVILIDDGLATGATMRAAVSALRQHAPDQIVVAVPIAAPATCTALEQVADRVICVETPEPLGSVGRWYTNFAQVTDDEVRELLRRAAEQDDQCCTLEPPLTTASS